MTLLTDKKLVKKEPKYGIQIRCAVQRHWAAVPVLDVKRDAPNLAIFEGLFHCSTGTTLSQSGKASESNMKASSIVVYWISGMAVCAMELK